MKSKPLTWLNAVVLFATLAVSPHLAAQAPTKHHHYKLIDLGTLGGPSSYKSVNAPGYQIINNAGVASVAGSAPTGPPSLNQSPMPTSPTRKPSISTPWSPTTPNPSPTLTAI